jgi:hypothetical protein
MFSAVFVKLHYYSAFVITNFKYHIMIKINWHANMSVKP